VDSFLPFIKALKRINPLHRRIVVMDNLSVHHSKIVKEEFDDKWFTCQFLPPQSCELNPIERVWNMIKQEWRKTQHLHALRDFEDEDERTIYSCARLRAIIGKNDL
jgi:transposase